MKKVVFVCLRNSGRSQMAEAFFNQMMKGRAEAVSAGTLPASQINPTVVQVMREVRIDISKQKPKPLSLRTLENADSVITMSCGAEWICPASLTPTEDWEIEDPEGKSLDEVRQIRDKVKAKVEGLVRALREKNSQ